MNLLGVDVGYSQTKRTTGLAWRGTDGKVEVRTVGTSWDERKRSLPGSKTFSIAALDAPILPDHQGTPRRGCEAVFYGGAFWNRCRPGLSHHGRALHLRKAGMEAAGQFAAVLGGKCCLGPGLTARQTIPIVEAFPNTFLGVLLPETVFKEKPKEKNEKKSDWLYRAAVCTGRIAALAKRLGWDEPRTIKKLEDEEHHDHRAALVCLLTAGFAASGVSTVVGDAEHGWFWLPPVDMWEPWAKQELRSQVHRLKLKFPKLSAFEQSHR